MNQDDDFWGLVERGADRLGMDDPLPEPPSRLRRPGRRAEVSSQRQEAEALPVKPPDTDHSPFLAEPTEDEVIEEVETSGVGSAVGGDSPPPAPSPDPDMEEDAATIVWEYEYFVHRWPRGGRPKGQFGVVVSQLEVKQTFWDAYQREILGAFQGWLDEGWQPISEVGPTALVIDDRQQSRLGEQVWPKLQRTVYLVEVRIACRRREA